MTRAGDEDRPPSGAGDALAWYRRPVDAAAFLRERARSAGIAVAEQSGPDGAPRILLRAQSGGGPGLVLSARLQGPTVRATAHHAVPGELTAQTFQNLNLVARTPWAGRAYPAPDTAATDVSLGLPAPASPDDDFPLAQLLGVVQAGAVQLAHGQLPAYPGPPPAMGEGAVLDAAAAWARHTLGPVELTVDGAAVAASSLSGLAGGQPVRAELFVVGGVLALRLVPLGDAAIATRDASDALLRALAGFNAGAAAGAAAWGPPSLGVHGIVAVPAALVPLRPATFGWLLDRAREVTAGALTIAGA